MVLLEWKGTWDEGGWVHLKGANSMAVSGLSLRKALVSNGHFSSVHKWAWKTVVSYCRVSITV